MSQVTVCLDRVDEPLRRLRTPCREGPRGGQLIESVIYLDGVESLGVKLEPPLRWRVFRIEKPAPVLVIPARTSDVACGLHNRAYRTYRSYFYNMRFDDLTKYFEQLEAASGRLKMYNL